MYAMKERRPYTGMIKDEAMKKRTMKSTMRIINMKTTQNILSRTSIY